MRTGSPGGPPHTPAAPVLQEGLHGSSFTLHLNPHPAEQSQWPNWEENIPFGQPERAQGWAAPDRASKGNQSTFSILTFSPLIPEGPSGPFGPSRP